jgi:hypothetical protein
MNGAQKFDLGVIGKSEYWCDNFLSIPLSISLKGLGVSSPQLDSRKLLPRLL